MYNTYRDLRTRIELNNVLKITLDNAAYANCWECFCHIQKQLHRMLLSHLKVAYPDSSDSSRLYPNER